MPIYETVLIARQDLTEAQVTDAVNTYSSVLSDAKGKILKTENWGLRALAYPINKNRKGYYVLIEFEVEPEALHEMERQMRLSEDILRFMTIKLDKASEGPSVKAQKAENKEAA